MSNKIRKKGFKMSLTRKVTPTVSSLWMILIAAVITKVSNTCTISMLVHPTHPSYSEGHGDYMLKYYGADEKTEAEINAF